MSKRNTLLKRALAVVGSIALLVGFIAIFNVWLWLSEGVPTIPQLEGRWWAGYYETTKSGRQWCVARFIKPPSGHLQMILLSSLEAMDIFDVERSSSDETFVFLTFTEPMQGVRIEAKQLYKGKRYYLGRLMAWRIDDFWKMNDDVAIRGYLPLTTPQREFAIEPIADDKLGDFWQRYVRPDRPTPSPADILNTAGLMASVRPLEDAASASEHGDYETALRLLRPLAEQGDAHAQFAVGAMYATGLGVKQDSAEAVMWLRKAADQGDAQAKSILGTIYTETQVAAESGDAQAEYNLGNMYGFGEGVKLDYTEAVKWYRKAAAQGVAAAQFNVGLSYAKGRGVAKDDAAAAKWYRKAAGQGRAEAQSNLGAMYENGLGVERDYAEAAKWYRKAAEQGEAAAQYNLGLLYMQGKGIKQDNAEAITWFLKAANQGNTQARSILETIYAKAKLVADQGDADAQYTLGDIYAYGQGVKQDYAEAVKWYQKAADQGHVMAQVNLGFMYANGQGVKQDYAEAVKWYQKAADQGDARAQFTLGFAYETGQGVPLDYVKAHKWFNLAASRFPASDTDSRARAIRSRDLVAGKMTSAQIAAALKQAQEWKP